MSPAGWILIAFLVLIVATPAVVLLSRNTEATTEENAPGNDNSDPDDSEDNTTRNQKTETNEDPTGETNSDHSGETSDEEPESDTENHGDTEVQTESAGEESRDEPKQAPESWNHTEKYENLIFVNRGDPVPSLILPELDPERQGEYNDRGDPDPPSRAVESAVNWLVSANTEAIHQRSKYNDFKECLEDFARAPRAAGADRISETAWRDNPPNLSRLIGERLLVMSLGRSASGHCEMDAHRNAFVELLREAWNDDGLDHPLVYQGIGRMGLLTPTPYTDLQKKLVKRIPGRTPRSENPGRLEMARYHALLLAVAGGETYPFPQSDRGLSRLWHWDEHNPPLAEWSILPPILFSLWIHHRFQGSDSDAANDFGALLGNWWDENQSSADILKSKPAIWEALLLSAWVLLPGENLIWDQIQQRGTDMDFEDETIRNLTEMALSWVEHYSETGDRPDNAPNEELMPPLEWIRPLPSDLVNEFSQPSFDFPEPWCEDLTEFSIRSSTTAETG